MPSTQADTPVYIYRLDARDRIVWVNPDWLKFAHENDFPSERLASVVGSVIWTHITGLATRHLYEELFASIRKRQTEIAIPFNCDSPTLVRHMTLTIRTMAGGALELEGRLNQSEPRPYAPILDRMAPRSEEALPICSICRKLLVRAGWVTVGEAVVRRRLFTQLPVPVLEETLCPACESLAIT